MIHNLYKYRGETPLECIHRYLSAHPELKKDKWTYAGRLDPMADGVLIALSGEDVMRKEEFTNLDKTYDFTALFGFATDTYDVLGKVVRVEKLNELDENEVRRASSVYVGERDQKYPPYSSKVRAWEDDKPSDIELPTRRVMIHNIQFHKLDRLSVKELMGRLLMDIGKVKGDFRQNEIMLLWKQMLENYGVQVYLGSFSASVSSGTYIRGIVNDLGNTLGIGACALSITRTSVGVYKIGDSVR